jgi:hypothetical protein
MAVEVIVEFTTKSGRREELLEWIEASGGFAPMLELLAAPPRTTSLEPAG